VSKLQSTRRIARAESFTAQEKQAMTSAAASRAVCTIEPATNDRYDQPYRFGKPLSYLSERQQVRLLIVRGRLQDTAAAADRPTASRASSNAATAHADRPRS
jgi:hypothetical protein